MAAALAGVRRGGSMVIVASPGCAIALDGFVTHDLTLRGSLWFPRETPSKLVAMIASGTLPLDRIKNVVFSLDEIDAALAASSRPQVPFQQVVVCP